jgi:putative hydrolase of the HAD superfamily
VKNSICAVFDVDDTLYLERDYVSSGFEVVGSWAKDWLQITDFAERCWSKFTSGRRTSIFDEVLNASGRKAEPELVSALVELYRTHVPRISLAPDASKALEAISRDVAIAIISDGPVASQSRKVEKLGLRSFAAPIILTEVLGSGFRKPHPRAFEYVRSCRPADLYLYVADNPAKDFAAPKGLGWMTVRVRRPNGLHSEVDNASITPDFEMSDCSMLPKLLARM